MSKRNHNVQTPGATPATAPEGDQVDGQAADTQSSADTPETTHPESTAAPAAKPAGGPLEMRLRAANSIDPSTLTAPVLSRDGWVIPTPKPATKG